MDKERDNLRVALDYALYSSHPDAAMRLVGDTYILWEIRGPWSEGQRLAEAALAGSAEGSSAARAKALLALAFFTFEQTDYSRGRELCEQSLRIWRELQNKWWCAFATGLLGELAGVSDPERGAELFHESVQLAREVNDQWLVAWCLKNSGDNAVHRGNLSEARNQLEESLRLIRAIDDSVIVDEVLLSLGEIAEAESDFPRAVRLYEESLAALQKFGGWAFTVPAKLELSRVLQITGDNDTAAHFFTEALEESLQRAKKITILRALEGLGVVAEARGNAPRAVRLFQASESLFDSLMENITLYPPERTWLERHRASARAKLGEDAFEEIRNEGRAMTLEQVVAYAVEQSHE
jgi:non-specific serine/threonine protein kinase